MNLGAPLHKALQGPAHPASTTSCIPPQGKFSTVPPRLGRKCFGAATLRGLALFLSVPCSSVAQSCLTLCHPMDCSAPGFPVHRQLPELLKPMSIESVMPSNHVILCRPLLLPPSIFPSIRVFSNEPALPIRWPKYWSFSFSISPSHEHSGLISFRMFV